MAKYDAAKAALAAAGVEVVAAEWPTDDETPADAGANVLGQAFYLQQFNGSPLSMCLHVFQTYMGQARTCARVRGRVVLCAFFRIVSVCDDDDDGDETSDIARCCLPD